MKAASFDTWTIIFLIAATQGLFVSLVYFFSPKRHFSRHFLGIITLAFSITLTAYVLYWTGYQYYYPYLLFIPVILVFCFGPIFYLYFKSIFYKDSLNLKDLLHFIPALIALLYYYPLIFSSTEFKQQILKGEYPNNGNNLSQLFVWAGVISLVSYSLIIYFQYRLVAASHKNIKNWFNLILIFFTGFALTHLSYYILCNFSFFNPSWDYLISATMTLFIYTLAWIGYRQPKVFDGFDLFEEEKVKYKNSPISGDIGKEIIEKLSIQMIEKKYFLYPDLNLEKLAELMQVNKHYLSQAINENLKMNFFEYINSLRIEEAKTLISSKKNYTFIEIAYQVGYNNKVSFNKAFKNLTGLTPTEFKNQIKEIKHHQN